MTLKMTLDAEYLLSHRKLAETILASSAGGALAMMLAFPASAASYEAPNSILVPVAAPAAPQWAVPVATHHVTARFRDRGEHWSSGFHTGLDFDAPDGTLVSGARAGIVTEAGYNGPYGNTVVVTGADGISTRYAHFSKTFVKAGDQVAVGARIGRIGSTGNATGPHLHFEVLQNGIQDDPETYLWGHRLAGQDF